jgi:hypothetical protein
MIEGIMPGPSATEAITLVDFAIAFETKTNSVDMPELPRNVSTQITYEYLSDIRDAACAGNAAEVARLMVLVVWRIARERRWMAEDDAHIEGLRRGRQ